MRSLLILACFLGVPVGTASAAPCAPSARVSGDPDLVASVTELLEQHGIATDLTTCPAVEVHVAHRGAALVVAQLAGRPPIEREVTELVAAATLIESWTRTDVDAPLLAVHHLASQPPAATAVAVAVAAPPTVSPRGLQVFFGLETSVAEDRSTWFGTQLGVCVMLGPVCAAARVRIASTTPEWERHVERRAIDVLFGGDVPFRLGATTLSPGCAAGLGAVHSSEMSVGGTETFGLRADAHVVWSIPIWSHLSVDLSAVADVTQVIDVESSSGRLADEPRILGRVGAGLRYGGL